MSAPPPALPADKKKKRAPLACSRCKSRKKRCDAEDNPAGCTNCLAAGVDCKWVDPLTQKEVNRGYVRKLEDKIAALELALAAQGVPTLDHLKPAPGAIAAVKVRAEVKEEAEGEEEGEASEDDLGLGNLSLHATAEALPLPPQPDQPRDQQFTLSAFFTSEVNRERPQTSAFPRFRFPTPLRMSDLGDPAADAWKDAFAKAAEEQYPLFPAALIDSLHSRRRSLESSLPFYEHSRTANFHLAALYLIYAIGAALLGDDAPATSLRLAALPLVSMVSQKPDLKLTQMSLLLTIYSLHARDGPSSSVLNNLSMRQCTDLGLHALPSSPPPASDRLHAFWTAFAIDRTLAFNLGRPVSIASEDITSPPPTAGDAFALHLSVLKFQEHVRLSLSRPEYLPSTAPDLNDLLARVMASPSSSLRLGTALAAMQLNHVAPQLLLAVTTPAQLEDAARLAARLAGTTHELSHRRPFDVPVVALAQDAFAAFIVALYTALRAPAVRRAQALSAIFAASNTVHLLSERSPLSRATRDFIDFLTPHFLPTLAAGAAIPSKARVKREDLRRAVNAYESAADAARRLRGSQAWAWQMVREMIDLQ
ncbi:hypothetical protein JCM8097_006248 [Rhodosporidiobolus ruineniae]